jgi:hypothetical protein
LCFKLSRTVAHRNGWRGFNTVERSAGFDHNGLDL